MNFINLPIDDAALDTDTLNSDLEVQKYEYKFDLNNFPQARPDPPVHSLAEVIASGKYHKASLEKFLASAKSYENGLSEPDYKDRRVKIEDLRVQLANLMAKNNVVALLYPHQKRLPVMIGEMNQAERNGILASLAGFPPLRFRLDSPRRWRARRSGCRSESNSSASRLASRSCCRSPTASGRRRTPANHGSLPRR